MDLFIYTFLTVFKKFCKRFGSIFSKINEVKVTSNCSLTDVTTDSPNQCLIRVVS